MSWLAQGHVYNSILKIFEPNLANETTWKIGPLTPSPFGGRNSQVWLYLPKAARMSEKQFPPIFRQKRLDLHAKKKQKQKLSRKLTGLLVTSDALAD